MEINNPSWASPASNRPTISRDLRPQQIKVRAWKQATRAPFQVEFVNVFRSHTSGRRVSGIQSNQPLDDRKKKTSVTPRTDAASEQRHANLIQLLYACLSSTATRTGHLLEDFLAFLLCVRIWLWCKQPNAPFRRSTRQAGRHGRQPMRLTFSHFKRNKSLKHKSPKLWLLISLSHDTLQGPFLLLCRCPFRSSDTLVDTGTPLLPALFPIRYNSRYDILSFLGPFSSGEIDGLSRSTALTPFISIRPFVISHDIIKRRDPVELPAICWLTLHCKSISHDILF